MDHSPRFLKLVEEAKSRVKEIGVEEAHRLVRKGEARLVDVREESEWAASHAQGAIHLGKGVIERDVEKRLPDANALIFLYCGGGFRSTLAAESLQRMGYTQVRSVAGGWRAWTGSGLPVSRLPDTLPRSPREKLGGIVHLARLIDKARLFPAGKLPGYNYLTSGLDKFLLDFLCLEGKSFERTVQESENDADALRRIKQLVGHAWPGDHAVLEFNDRMLRRRPDNAEKQAKFDQARAALPATRRKVETVFDLIDLEEGRFE